MPHDVFYMTLMAARDFMPALATATRPLARLRSDLNRLRRRRRWVRLGTAACTAGLIALAAVSVAFFADYGLDLNPLPRAVMLVAVVCAAGWAARIAVGKWLGADEQETDLALIVERRHGLGGDLVAALQFQSDEAAAWGSAQLERAVIRSIEDVGREIDPFDGFSWKPLPSRSGWFVLAVASIAVAAAFYPAHANAFLQRLALADVAYPTRTQIAALSINGHEIVLGESTPLRAPAGLPLVFAATAGGERPRSGTVSLTGGSGATTDVSLKPTSGSNDFRGTLEAFTEPVSFVVRLGDAKSRPRQIDIVPPPLTTLDLIPTAPKYARDNAPPAPPAGARTIYVLEGSSVDVTVHSANKPLRDVKLVTKSSRAAPRPLKPSADRKTWTLQPAPPFDIVREPLDFSFEITDDDGLSPTEPLTGSIRLRADHPPRVNATAVVRRILPTGRPEVVYNASDDFGVKEVKASLAVHRVDGSQTEQSVALPLERDSIVEAHGKHALDFSSLNLAKGDQVMVTVVAEDARGDRAGESATAEPITFEVTDREGLLSGLLDADEEGAERLDAIIRRELGIGAQR
jgi:hypothetical protein